VGLSIPGLVEVRRCPHGRGLFACRDLARGSMIREFRDIVLTSRPRRYALQIGENEYWDGFPRGSRDYWSNFIDHSDRPNAAFVFDGGRTVAWLKAVRRIGRGSEIFIDYGEYHDANPTTF
jgi:hypothetical protein